MSDSLPACNLSIPENFYSCSNPYPNCTNPYGFQFSSLWEITKYVAACPSDPRLFDPKEPSLTKAACHLFVGSSTWTPYSNADIYSRVATWKFPLLQLVSVFPRPPLSLGNEAFIIVHLLGNPIGVLKSLLLKIASCQRRADFWITRFDGDLGHLIGAVEEDRTSEKRRRWKALALIVDSYDEWGYVKGERAQEYLLARLSGDMTEEEKVSFLDISQRTADALAADRATKFLPVMTAQAIFIGTIAIAFGRTPSAAAPPNPSTYINIEAHSIAFSALYFWLIPAVILASVIGVSQTENAIPRILRDFQSNIDQSFPSEEHQLPNDHLFDGEHEISAMRERQQNGGFYSWQPEHVRRELISNGFTQTPQPATSRMSKLFQSLSLAPGSLIFASMVFIFSQVAGMLISALVPPKGFWCRGFLELGITVLWGFNGLVLDRMPRCLRWDGSCRYTKIYRLMFIKDTFITLATLILVLITQIGILNQCSCYSVEGKTGLAFPEISSVAGTLSYDIVFTYPAIAFLCIGFELVIFPGIVYYQYAAALSVYLQRDDGQSNLRFWYSFRQSSYGKPLCDFFLRLGAGIWRLLRQTKRIAGPLVQMLRKIGLPGFKHPTVSPGVLEDQALHGLAPGGTGNDATSSGRDVDSVDNGRQQQADTASEHSRRRSQQSYDSSDSTVPMLVENRSDAIEPAPGPRQD